LKQSVRPPIARRTAPIAKFSFRATNKWMGGDKNRSTIKEFTGALQEQRT
jgi:hypothetical protein